jgi:hypothetical protein
MSPRPVTLINLLSGPRNVSTALMYAFAQREDAAVVDEPLYGHYLKRTRAPQPHWEELIELLETDAEKIVREVILAPPAGKSVWFIKNMAHHLIELDCGWLHDPRMVSVFLIRDPAQMLPSLSHQVAEPTLRDAAYESQVRWFRELGDSGLNPQVVDAKALLLDPPGVLARLCHKLGIPFDPAMLSWAPGPRPEDGLWAKYWYDNVHRSTGFAPYSEKTDPFPERLRPLLEECRPHYEFLLRHAIQPD